MSGKILNIVSPAKELHVKFLSQYLLTCYVPSMFIYFKQLGSLIQDTFIPYLFIHRTLKYQKLLYARCYLGLVNEFRHHW